MHNDVRQVSRIGGEMSAQLAEIGQSAMVEIAREPIGELGQSLKLPPWEEANRGTIAAALPPISLPR